MTKKIFKNTFITSVISIILSISLLLVALYNYFEDQVVVNLKSEGNILANGLKHADEKFFDDFIPSEGVRITWIGTDGEVLYDSSADVGNMENHSQREEVIKAVEKGEGEAVRYSETLSERTMYYAKLLDDNTIIRISYRYETVNGIFASVLQPVITVLFVVCIAMYIVANYTAKAIVAPINNIDLENVKIEGVKDYPEIKPLLKRLRHQNILIDTKVRELKREHSRRETFRREFTANVSHELKTPLTSISGISEMMMNGIIKPEDIPEFAENISKEANRLISLVNDIILISELEGNELHMQKENVDVVQLVSSVMKRLEIPASKRNISMTMRVEEYSGNIVSDSDSLPEIEVSGVYNMLEELVTNLGDNAIKYNRDNGKVAFIVKENEKNVQIIVEDTGIGIPSRDKLSVFERFYRVDKGRSKEVGGTGLGLSIVKHVAIYHGGSVRAEDRMGGGTRMIAQIGK